MAPALITHGGEQLDALAARLRAGEVGILPTDTLYGLSGDASRAEVVARINAIKERARPATVIPPDIAWAQRVVDPAMASRMQEQLMRYPGETLLFSPGPAAGELPASLTDSGLISLRVPQHWIAALAQRAGLPIVTTSANRTTLPPMTCMADLDPLVRDNVDFIVEEGTLDGPPSAMVFFNEDPPRRVVR